MEDADEPSAGNGCPAPCGFCKGRVLTALRRIAEARGGMAKVAKQAAEKLDVALDFGWRSGLPLR
jgi:hypothetical protein